MALVEVTTLARVKALLDMSVSVTTQDAVLNALIAGVSQRFEGFIGRPISAEARTEVYDWPDNRRTSLFLRAYPVSSVATIKNATDWDFSAATALDAADFNVDAETGEVVFVSPLLTGTRVVQVVYTAGLAANTAALIAAHPVIASAGDLQVAAVWRRRASPQGSVSLIPGQGSLTQESALDLIPEVQSALWPYRRVRFGV